MQPNPDTPARWHAACELAGHLAELGITRLQLIGRGGEAELAARETDLPRLLFDAAAEGQARVRSLEPALPYEWVSDESGLWIERPTSQQPTGFLS